MTTAISKTWDRIIGASETERLLLSRFSPSIKLPASQAGNVARLSVKRHGIMLELLCSQVRCIRQPVEEFSRALLQVYLRVFVSHPCLAVFSGHRRRTN